MHVCSHQFIMLSICEWIASGFCWTYGLSFTYQRILTMGCDQDYSLFMCAAFSTQLSSRQQIDTWKHTSCWLLSIILLSTPQACRLAEDQCGKGRAECSQVIRSWTLATHQTGKTGDSYALGIRTSISTVYVKFERKKNSHDSRFACA